MHPFIGIWDIEYMLHKGKSAHSAGQPAKMRRRAAKPAMTMSKRGRTLCLPKQGPLLRGPDGLFRHFFNGQIACSLWMDIVLHLCPTYARGPRRPSIPSLCSTYLTTQSVSVWISLECRRTAQSRTLLQRDAAAAFASLISSFINPK